MQKMNAVICSDESSAGCFIYLWLAAPGSEWRRPPDGGWAVLSEASHSSGAADTCDPVLWRLRWCLVPSAAHVRCWPSSSLARVLPSALDSDLHPQWCCGTKRDKRRQTPAVKSESKCIVISLIVNKRIHCFVWHSVPGSLASSGRPDVPLIGLVVRPAVCRETVVHFIFVLFLHLQLQVGRQLTSCSWRKTWGQQSNTGQT